MNHDKAKTGSYMEINSAELRRIKNASPTDDAYEAIRRNDFRFLAVKGYALTVPGIDDYHEWFGLKHKYRIIEGTTDTPRDNEDFRLQDRAIEYAKSYNLVIRDYLAKQK